MFHRTRIDGRRIAEAIAAAERHCGGEIVTVVAAESDRYRFIPLLWAALAALLLPAPFWLWQAQTGLFEVHALQSALFASLALCFSWRPLKMLLVPKSIKTQRARRMAREQYLHQRLPSARHGAGVLLFVSLGERYVEIIADESLMGRVPQTEWDGVIAEFTAQVRAGRITEGFLSAIAACGSILSDLDLPGSGTPAETQTSLSDRLVEI